MISDKSVSRQHLTIEVANVGPDDCVRSEYLINHIHTDTSQEES